MKEPSHAGYSSGRVRENACLNCDFFDACHFTDGQNGERCRYMPKLGADQVWDMLEEEQRR